MITNFLWILLNKGSQGAPLGKWATYVIPALGFIFAIYVIYSLIKGAIEIFKMFK